ncbi:MAG: response regulator [Pseudooceanicola sp.]|nr:response regulator [Pseudooceanicola sp.]
MKIPVMIVDDEKVDRYTARRRLLQHGGFAEPLESESGDAFLEIHCSTPGQWPASAPPHLILMDINMPGRDGFATIEELERRHGAGLGPPALIVTMFTSSSSPRDRARADELRLVQGYVEKPLEAEGARRLYDLYMDFLREKGLAA